LWKPFLRDTLEAELRFRLVADYMESWFRLSSSPMPPLETQSGIAERPLRADAARNRAKVLAAARDVFADDGLEAEMAAIAERADVGVGTVYRHFPTKEALLAALANAHFERLADNAEAAMAEGGTAWEVFERVIWRNATATAEDHGMCDVLAQAAPTMAALPPSPRLQAIGAQLMDAAVAEGSARPDATGEDIPMMMCGFGKVASLERRRGETGGFSWRRYLTIMLDGLRAR
jgi:AcrR family transcriptional regulator